MSVTLLDDLRIEECPILKEDIGEGSFEPVFVAYVDVGWIKLQSHPLALNHLLGKSGSLSAKVFYGLLWVLRFRCVYTDQADPLPSTNNDGISINDPGNKTPIGLS